MIRRLPMHPNHHRIIKGLLATATFLIASKLVAMLKEMAVASRYGVSSEVDAYLLAMTVVTWLPVTLSSVGVVVLVPRLVALQRDSRDDRFLRELNGSMCLIAGLLVPLTFAAGPWLITHLLQSPAGEHGLARSMTLQLAAFSGLSLLAAYLGIRLQSRSNQANAFFEAMPALCILILILVPWPESGTLPLVLGTLAGGLVQVLVLALLVRGDRGGLGGFSLGHESALWRGIYGGALLMSTAQILIGLSTPIDQFAATGLGGGAIATLGYANRVIAIAAGLGATAIGRAMLPVLADATSRGDIALARHQTRRWMVVVFWLTTAAAVLGWIAAPWCIRLLFERGAFTPDDTDAVAQVLRVLLLQLPFYLTGIIGVQLLASEGRYASLLLATIAALCAKIVSLTVLLPMYGLHGIALSTAIMYSASAALIAWQTRRTTLRTQ